MNEHSIAANVCFHLIYASKNHSDLLLFWRELAQCHILSTQRSLATFEREISAGSQVINRKRFNLDPLNVFITFFLHSIEVIK
jgi:hypothetical protein